MAAFEVAALIVALAGLGAVGRTVLPMLRPATPTAPPGPSLGPDIDLALQALDDRILLDDDDPTPWTLGPLEPGAERLPSDLRPWDGVVTAGDHLVPLGSCLLATGHDGDLLRGRRQGRAIHAVRLVGDVFLDLYEASRLLPVLAVELDARAAPRELSLADRAQADGLELLAAWSVTGTGPRVVPEGEGARSWELTLEGEALRVEAWIPDVRTGLVEDALRWAGVARLGDTSSVGGTPPTVLDHLALAASEPVGWTRRELLELAAVLQQLESQDVDLSAFLLEVFADHRAPAPDPAAPPQTREEQALVCAALLNWVGASHRRAGRPRAGLAVLDAALSVCGPDDTDTLGDIHHNRGLCWLDLRALEPHALDEASASFSRSTDLHPADPAPWLQTALVHHLRDDLEAAAEAWLQAATRVPGDDERKAILLANAEACEGASSSSTPS